MDTELNLSSSQCKVLILPPVCVSQRLIIPSSLPDTRNTPSDEKETDLTQPLCPEKAHIWLPVIELKIIMSPDVKPTAMVLFQYEIASGL